MDRSAFQKIHQLMELWEHEYHSCNACNGNFVAEFGMNKIKSCLVNFVYYCELFFNFYCYTIGQYTCTVVF